MEIERRWLVNGWPEGTPAQVWHMAQGYFAVRPAVRIRREAREGGPVQYVLCIKGKGGLGAGFLLFSLALLATFVVLALVLMEIL